MVLETALVALAGEGMVPHSGSPLAPMFALGTGIALRGTVVLITLQVAPLASSVAPSRMTLPVVEGSTATCPAPEPPLVLATLGEAAAQDGNPGIGSVAGLDAMNTTLLVEWNASGATPPGTPLPDLTDTSHPKYDPYCELLVFDSVGPSRYEEPGKDTYVMIK